MANQVYDQNYLNFVTNTSNTPIDTYNGYSPDVQRSYMDTYKGLANTGNIGNNQQDFNFGNVWDNMWQNDQGKFDFGSGIDTLGSIAGLAYGAANAFGITPQAKRQKEQHDAYMAANRANIANQKETMAMNKTLANNEISRGSKARARVNGGVDSMVNV